MTRCSQLKLGLLLASLSFVPVITRAQTLNRSVRLTVDNDYFDFWLPPLQRPDDNYTQGARLGWDVTTVPPFAQKLICRSRAACGLTVEFGQQMYTPTVDNPFPLPGERPYAGLLYGLGEVRSGTTGSLRSVGVLIGTTGTPSLAEYAQVHFHERFGFRRPLGWQYQLRAEPAFTISGAQSWRVAPSSVGGFADFIPTVSAKLGTLRTSATAGARMRVGPRLQHPWLAGPSQIVSVGAFVGGHIEAVARDLFLDGNTFEGSPRVEGEPIRTEGEAGVHFDAGRFGIEYTVVRQSREYRHGPATHTYGSLSISWKLN